jgi:GntR family transcriptional regulator/MocR family aminotransferase
VPLSEVDRFYRAAELFAPSSSLLDQMVVADFMIEGHFARHLKRMRRLYAARRDALVSALRTVFDDRLVLDVPAGGMHVIGRFCGRRNDVALAERAQREDLALLSSCLDGRPSELGLLLSFTNIPVEEATRAAQRLHRLLFG